MIEIAGAVVAWLLITLALWADEVADQAEAARVKTALLDGWEVLPPCLT